MANYVILYKLEMIIISDYFLFLIYKCIKYIIIQIKNITELKYKYDKSNSNIITTIPKNVL